VPAAVVAIPTPVVDADYARPQGASPIPAGHFQTQRDPAYRPAPIEVDDSLVVPRVQSYRDTAAPRVPPPPLVVYDDTPLRRAHRLFAFTLPSTWHWRHRGGARAVISKIPILADTPGAPLQAQQPVWLKPRIERPSPLPWDLSYVIRSHATVAAEQAAARA